jgi:hypothetical protein
MRADKSLVDREQEEKRRAKMSQRMLLESLMGKLRRARRRRRPATIASLSGIGGRERVCALAAQAVD